MTISMLRRMLGALLLAGLLIGCDVAPATRNSTAGPGAQPGSGTTSQPAPAQGTGYPAPGPATAYPAPGLATAYPAPTASP